MWRETTDYKTLFSLLAMALALPVVSVAFQGAATTQAEHEVVIKREALSLTDPKEFKVLLQLSPIKSLELTAPIDGYVRGISAKLSQKLTKEGEALRLDDARATLLVKRAKAQLQAAKLEKKLAKADADAGQLADLRIEASQADLDLAQADAERLVIRAPFAGDIVHIAVVEGQFVRAGDRLATLVDTSRLQVEIPIERSKTSAGSTIDLKVEDTAIKAKVEAVLSPPARFEPLRDLCESLAAGVATVDNPQGKLQAGQAVYLNLVPVHPVASVPTAAVSNVPDGTRKVQVLRENVVRNIVVTAMARVGTERVFVSGPFQPGDEVITGASRELADGTPVRALLAAMKSESSTNSSGATKPAPPAAGQQKKPTTGF